MGLTGFEPASSHMRWRRDNHCATNPIPLAIVRAACPSLLPNYSGVTVHHSARASPWKLSQGLAYVNDVRESWAVAYITVSRSDPAHRRVALSAPAQEPGPGVRALSRALSGGERGSVKSMRETVEPWRARSVGAVSRPAL